MARGQGLGEKKHPLSPIPPTCHENELKILVFLPSPHLSSSPASIKAPSCHLSSHSMACLPHLQPAELGKATVGEAGRHHTS